ncbi:MAG: pyruvate carboxylase subunit B [Clostridia bacterium]|nr:pyruvate carboxylase subunit B [Clostridia bacterium]MBP5648976.1 pyruvate carboxylase subunit B [Clostridia bacterium]
MAKRPVKIMETILRDAHQSQAATRMRITDMLPVADKLDKIGYYALEAWGGATFDSCIRFLDEDPWERLITLRKAIPNTKLQMLLRGQNLLGYRHYSDDVVKAFVDLTVKNGIDVLRIFDALNDINNLQTAIEATKEAKEKYGRGAVEAALSYTTGPVYDNSYYVNKAKELKAMGADIICIKDMANLLKPYAAYDLVSALKDAVDLPIHIHTHNTAGIGDMTNLKAIEAGADIVDTALSPLGNGTSQPATESLVATLQGTDYDTGIDLKKLNELTVYFRTVAERLKKDGVLSEKVLKVDVNALIYQVPGGMLSNLINQLKEQGKSEKLEEVLSEVPNVRADLGYPPLVTPSSQIVGTQAVLNVIMGERYKMVTKETKGIARGEYGRLPVEPNPEAIKKILGDEKPIKYSPHDLPPELDKLRTELGKYYEKDEDVLTYALFPQVSMPFFQKRYAKHHGVDTAIFDKEGIHPV